MKDKEIKNKKELSIGGIVFGVFAIITAISYYDDDSALMLLAIGFGFLLTGAGYLVFLNLQKVKLLNEQRDRLFYELLKNNSGRITLIQFASATNLPPKEAREYLEKKATEFGTVADVDYDGVINYTFK